MSPFSTSNIILSTEELLNIFSVESIKEILAWIQGIRDSSSNPREKHAKLQGKIGWDYIKITYNGNNQITITRSTDKDSQSNILGHSVLTGYIIEGIHKQAKRAKEQTEQRDNVQSA